MSTIDRRSSHTSAIGVVCTAVFGCAGIGISIGNCHILICFISTRSLSTIRHIVCRLGVTHVGSRIFIPLAIHLVTILTITTTKQLIDDMNRLHQYVGSRHRCCITTTIHLPNARHITSFDDNLCFVLIDGWNVSSQVTTTINRFNIIINIRRVNFVLNGP